jgi:pimeloyl-ACP methyl ester carboxylesterase
MDLDLEKLDELTRHEETDTFKVGDVDLYYEYYGGPGPTLTILNNFFNVAPMWKPFVSRLAESNRVLTYDMRNQGGSSFVANPTWEEHLADLGGLLDGLGVERTFLIGTSVSSLLCRDYALAHPARVAGLILVGPAISPYGGGKRRAMNKTWMTTLAQSGPADLWDQLWAVVLSAAMIERGGPATYHATREAFATLITRPDALHANLASAMEASDDPELLRGLACPTAVIAGDCDFMCSPSELEALAALIPDCETTLLPNVGHMPNWEATGDFEAAAQAFIDRHGAEE